MAQEFDKLFNPVVIPSNTELVYLRYDSVLLSTTDIKKGCLITSEVIKDDRPILKIEDSIFTPIKKARKVSGQR